MTRDLASIDLERIAAMSAAGFFFITWGMNSLNLSADWLPPSYVGTVLGFSGTGNGLGTLIVTRANPVGCWTAPATTPSCSSKSACSSR